MTSAALMTDAEILDDLRRIHAKYPNPGVLGKPMARRAIEKWALVHVARIPSMLPAVRLYWRYGQHLPHETPSPVPAASLILWHALVVGYGDDRIARDVAFRDVLKDIDVRGHRFCRMADVIDLLADPDEKLGKVLSGCNRVFDFTRDTPFSDFNMRHLTGLVRALSLLAMSGFERRVVVDEAGGRSPAWVALAATARSLVAETENAFHMPEIFAALRAEADAVENRSEEHGCPPDGCQEVRGDAKTRLDLPVGVRVHDLREMAGRLGIRDELRRWLVC